MRDLGSLGFDYDLEEIPESERVFSPDRTRVAAWWVARHREERGDDSTDYVVVVWDSATGGRVARYRRGSSNDREGHTHGDEVCGVRFDGSGRFLDILLSDGRTQQVEIGRRREAARLSPDLLEQNMPEWLKAEVLARLNDGDD